MNNNEINCIIKLYLNIWSKNRDVNYVNISDIALLFRTKSQGYINHFFVDEKVSCNEFILFVCFYLFYSNEEILTILVAMSGVSSKLYISKEQVDQFFVNYTLEKSKFKELDYILETSKPSLLGYKYLYYIFIYSCPHEAYNLKSFQNYLLNNIFFIDSISRLKQELSVLTFDSKAISTINERIEYYNEVFNVVYGNLNDNPTIYNNNNYKKKPHELCCSKVRRVLFSMKPNPYHFDFKINTTSDKAKSNVLLMLKQRYGYSRKSSTYCKISLTSPSIVKTGRERASLRNRTLLLNIKSPRDNNNNNNSVRCQTFHNNPININK